LHDIGILVQGFFFWEWFERIVRATDDGAISFHEAEEEMGGLVTHEFIGELLIRKSEMSKDLVSAVGLHHETGDSPGSLVSLVHVSNSLVKELGMGYFDKEPTDYNRPALDALKLTRQGVRAVKDVLAEEITGQVKSLVKQCMS
jgi:HD-like signal output (HDOD) protein